MSWTEKLKKGLEITTGDGKKFFPLYLLDPKTTNFNVAEFEFPNIEGTLVKRSLVKGTRHKLTFFFQGEDHLEESLAFETSAKDKRPFKISHPFFGLLTVQPTSLEYDPTGLNLTKITGEFIETIGDEYPRIVKDNKNEILFNYENTKKALNQSFSSNVRPTASDYVEMGGNNDKLYSLGAESVKSGNQANEYFQIYQRANASISSLAANTNIVAQYAIDLYVKPSLFINKVKNRITLLANQLESISDAIDSLNSFNQKTIYEMTGASIVAGMVNASVNPAADDFQNSNEVVEIIDLILVTWELYLDNLQGLQTITNDTVDSYVPDFDSLNQLINLVNFGTSNLLNIALQAQSQRSILLDSDSNAIILAHRFYGLNAGDSMLNKFINQNNLSKTELFQIKKGRKIVYFV